MFNIATVKNVPGINELIITSSGVKLKIKNSVQNLKKKKKSHSSFLYKLKNTELFFCFAILKGWRKLRKDFS